MITRCFRVPRHAEAPRATNVMTKEQHSEQGETSRGGHAAQRSHEDAEHDTLNAPHMLDATLYAS